MVRKGIVRIHMAGRICSEVDPNAMLPKAKVPQDTFDHRPVIDQGDNPHLPRTSRTQERIGFPHFLDEFAPFGRWDAPWSILRNVDHLDALAGGGLGILGRPLAPLSAHLVGVPPVVSDKLKTLVGDVLPPSLFELW
jgi:hypothetical protein